MSIRNTLLATVTMALVTVAGAASATAAPTRAPVQHPAVKTTVVTHAAVTVRAPAPRIVITHRTMNNHHVVSDRIVMATLRAHRLTALGRPQMIRGHLVVRARNARGRIVMVELNRVTGRLIGVIRV